MHFLSQRKILINFVIMALVWLVTVFNVYLFGYLVNTFDDEYTSALGSSAADIVSQIAAGIAFNYIGLKKNFIIAFGASSLGGLILWTWGLSH